MVASAKSNRNPKTPLPWAIACVVVGVVLYSLTIQSILQSRISASFFLSETLWYQLASDLNADFSADFQTAEIGFAPILFALFMIATVSWIGGAIVIARQSGNTFIEALASWGIRGWVWWILNGGWEVLRIVAFSTGLESIQTFLLVTPHLFVAFMTAGWLATFYSLSSPKDVQVVDIEKSLTPKGIPLSVWGMIGLFVVTLTTMNWRLYDSLLIPHGDSAMYEEHLWNLTHGKGFRSYLDQGLFLGEHVQVVHLLLVPLHVIWPSHRLLELSESLVLALGAIPVFWLTLRHTNSKRAAVLLAAAYLLYFPMQFLDISIDQKTFRPISFGVPALLFAIDQFERRKWGRFFLLLLLTFSAKEDFALVIAPLGLWIAFDAWMTRNQNAATSESSERKRQLFKGCIVAVFSFAYLLMVVFVILPWFRGGDNPHYYRYFGELGSSPGDILRTTFETPSAVISRLLSWRTVVYVLLMLLPVGFLSLLSAGRLAVALPWFAILCLLQLSPDQPNELLIPFHHFHAPIIPIIFWAAAAGLGRVSSFDGITKKGIRWISPSEHPQAAMLCLVAFGFASSLTTGALIGTTPLSVKFWDPGRAVYWRQLYIPGRRVEQFDRVVEQIPIDSKVASTDFVHTRFTHHERPYDYSQYLRKISNYEAKVPDDTDYIVIDTQHKYSTIKKPSDVRELREHPEQWELLPDKTEGYFIILKRKKD